VKEKTLVFPPEEDCYIYRRPNSSVWQYFLSIPTEGEERKSTKQKDKNEALKVARDRKLEVMMRQKQGLKARRVKKMFDFIDEYLEQESKRIADYNRKGHITAETFRVKKHHMNLLKKFYHDRSIKLEDLDYNKLYDYPSWRQQVEDSWNPNPPKTNHTILTELTTIKGYFDYLERLGFIDRTPRFAPVKRESLRVNRRDYLNAKQYQQTLNTLRSWSNSKNLTETQSYNKQILYQCILIMANSCCRIGELRKLRWYDLEVNSNLSKEEQKIGHLIRIRPEITKTGVPRMISTPTSKSFQKIRELSGIPKHPKTSFPHVSPDRMGDYVISKYNHPDQQLGQGTWDRLWKEIKDLCGNRYWGAKNISWYSFRHTGISFAVTRGVPMLLLSRNAGTGSRYIEDVYFHHESESKKTWDTLMQNRVFYNKQKEHQSELLVEIEDLLDGVDETKD
jgi:integrase